MKHPRRGGFAADVDPVDPRADAELAQSIETNEERLQWAAWDLVNDPDPNPLVVAARRYRNGDVSAVGAAALAVLLARTGKPDEGTLVVDGWVARHGATFAVQSLLEASDMRRVANRVPVDDLPDGINFIWVQHGDSSGNEMELPRYVVLEQLGQVDDPNAQVTYTVLEHMLDRMRGLLTIASDDDYVAARDMAETLRTNTTRRLAATYLFPTEREWSDELIMGLDAIPHRWRTHLLVSSNTTAQLERAADGWGPRLWLGDEAILAALVDGVGAEITTALTAAFDTEFPYRSVQDDAIQLSILHALSSIPTDDAFSALLERADVKNALPAVLNAIQHYPRRAFTILASADSGLFDRHVRENPDLAAALADTLPAPARRRIAELTTTVPESTDLPAILVTPPWLNRRRATTPPVIDGLTAPVIHRMAWLPAELEEICATPHDYSYTTWEQYRQYVRNTTPQNVNEWEAWIIFLLAPDEVARPLLTDWETTTLREPHRVVARYELDALPLLLRVARARPGAAAPYLMPYVDLDVARLHATMYATRKNLRRPALSWLVRHTTDAITLLVPDAVGKAGAGRDHAAAALGALARATTPETVIYGAEQYGADAAEAVRALLDVDPLDVLPKRIPTTPAWAYLESLPPILTADRSAALPASAVSTILTMCAISTADAPYAGLDTVTSFCDRASLAAAIWELFERWWGAGAPSKDNWIVLALGWLGDDATVTRLAPLIRRWPGDGGTARAQLGLDALAAHGSARALTELDRMSRKMKFKSLKNGAAERVAEVAERLGLDHEQLADRTVPDLDLSPDGTMTLDFGPRTITLRFTEALVPFAVDESGKKSAGLPKATVNDDAALVEDAKKRFAALKREAKTVAAEQIKRFNRSMVTGRRWDGGEFTEYVLGHPLLLHIARRLLWASFDENSRPTVVFRVAEDNTFADIDGNTVALADGPIGLVHPAHIPDTVRTWSHVFADYEILQPFPQLGRPVHHPLPGDVDGSGLSRFTGVTATPSQALRLTYRGWDPVWENPAYPSQKRPGGQGLLYRLSDTVSVLLGLDPGMGTGSPYDGYPDQKLVSVDLRGGTLDDADSATVSELLADLAGFAS
ncbi:DUF4132 domain-containing protein [Rhodococcus spelaei]|uniref:DUF4132 domain-containing protein n=1 Tax=Rhodococcus spelaei TaxID=2546320 RepID=A0A541AZD5_9NOCA|nr:DUF4132 domain-containing protein [Rhodococcus spelaei]TQF65430.1 DUF4132 domain-containing protein [Rhodococcus spelaei]